MEKRVFLAIFLSFAVLAVYQVVFPPPPPSSVVQNTSEVTGTSAAPIGTQPSVVQNPAVPAVAALVGAEAARDVVVETDTIRAIFSTAGGTLRSWTLKKYLENGAPLELVPSNLPDTFVRPFTLSTNDDALSKVLAAALFKPSADSLSLGAEPGTLSFEYRDVSGLNARKTFYFQPEGKAYVLKVEASVDVAGASKPVTLAWGPAVGLGYAPDGAKIAPTRGVIFRDNGVEYLDADDIQEQPRYEDQLRFAGVEDQYFLSAALPGSERVTINYSPVTLPVPGNTSGVTRHFISYSVTVPGALSVPFFQGPKDFDILRAVDPQLVRAIDFGMFAWLVVPLLRSLKWVHGYVGNYGWAIVILTILINVAIFPLRHRSMVSMRKMQTLQPEVKAIQDRYAKYKLTDPERQKMNQEMMGLYKQKGVNPVSGCIPMLLTMPILFAFYAMLSAAIELRGAPFFGWIHDLARHDPLYVTPVLMGLTMFWQQRMMPTTADPIQQRIFLLMPVIFTVSFLWAPAGLVVYWFVSNLLAIGQQYFTNSIIGAPPTRPTKVSGNAIAAKA